MTLRNFLFFFFNIVTIVIFYIPLKELFALSLSYDPTYSHIPLIPLISAYLIYSERKKIFSDVENSFFAGSIFIIIGIALSLTGRSQESILGQNDYLSLMTFSVLIFWLGGFVLFYGIKASRNALFPLLILLFMVPIPAFILDKTISILQNASAEVAHGLFMISGIPFFREGLTFHLSELSVEVAEQCSGIRSSIALFITGLLAGHLFLESTSKKIILLLAVFPITIFKNGLRILTLALLGNYVDVRILSSTLHKKGGIPFFILALTVLGTVLWFLRRMEKRNLPTRA
ncbi:transmembrane exosortase [bacterium BMS3Abin10]|nr:transmembrane exosortase [bacterium BMS3Abin10]GBE38648.1 transmembrane exosortase [bacterium BMS3Bbin08]